MPSIFRRLWLVLWRILGIAGDLHFGWSMLVQYILPSGAGAVLLTALLDYVSGFGAYLARSHWLFRWAVYLSVFILIFVALNHLITLGIKAYRRSRARRRSTSTQPPSTTIIINPQGDTSPEAVAREWWRERIKEWRSVIHAYDLDRLDDRQRFLRTDAYSQMKKYGLKPDVVEMFEADRTFHVGKEVYGGAVYKPTLLEEVARIENERVFNMPESITNQATTPLKDDELKHRCIRVSEELSTFLDRREKFRNAGAETDIVFGDHRGWPQKTMADYRDKFEREVVTLLDDLEQRGWLTAESRAHLKLPTDDPQTIREVAARLSGICNRH